MRRLVVGGLLLLLPAAGCHHSRKIASRQERIAVTESLVQRDTVRRVRQADVVGRTEQTVEMQVVVREFEPLVGSDSVRSFLKSERVETTRYAGKSIRQEQETERETAFSDRTETAVADACIQSEAQSEYDGSAPLKWGTWIVAGLAVWWVLRFLVRRLEH